MACDNGQGVGRRLNTTPFKIRLDVRGRNRQHTEATVGSSENRDALTFKS